LRPITDTSYVEFTDEDTRSNFELSHEGQGLNIQESGSPDQRD